MTPPVWVLDTNVLVSGMLNPTGYPGRLVDAVLNGDLTLALDDRILAEYTEVLKRPKFEIAERDLQDLVVYLQMQHRADVRPQPPRNLPDPDDLPFAEVASSLNERVLVTGNSKDFPPEAMGGIKVVSPRKAWEELIRRTL